MARHTCPLFWKRPFEHAGRDLLRIDVVEHDTGIVAAEFERDALQRLGRARHHLFARRRRAREGNLADIGVMRHRVAEIVGVGDDVEHARRQNVGNQFGEFQRRERRRRRRLDDQRIARDQRRRQLEAEDQQRIVPGNDGADHAERTPKCFRSPLSSITRIGRSSEPR
jgi:hypothetical protein